MDRRFFHQLQAMIAAAGQRARRADGAGEDAAIESALATGNDLDLPTGQRGHKDFDNARAAGAILGCELLRVDGYFLARHGNTRYFPSLQAVQAFLNGSFDD